MDVNIQVNHPHLFLGYRSAIRWTHCVMALI